MNEHPTYRATKRRQEVFLEQVVGKHGQFVDLPLALTDSAHAHAERFLKSAADAAETDCEKGCSYCCHQPATVFPFEALTIARFLSSNLSKGALAALKDKMRTRVAGLKEPSVAKNIENKTACPLLTDDGLCSVYAHRPLTCRMAHSFSVRRCRSAFQKVRAKVEIPLSLELLTGLSGIIEAHFEELPRRFKLDGNLYELCSAVLRALDEPGAGLRWAQGKPNAFEACIKDDT